MNKNDLVNQVSDNTGLSKSDSAKAVDSVLDTITSCLLYTSPSPRDKRQSRMPSSA